MTLTYDEVRSRVADALERAAEAQEARRYNFISGPYEEITHMGPDFPPRSTPEEKERFRKVTVAINFFDGWVEASNHDLSAYEGISAGEWPELGRKVASALREDREIDVAPVLRHFDVASPVASETQSLLGRLKGLFRGS